MGGDGRLWRACHLARFVSAVSCTVLASRIEADRQSPRRMNMAARTYIQDGEGIPNWSNPVSHAVVVNGTCYVSGQLSVSQAGGYMEGTV